MQAQPSPASPSIDGLRRVLAGWLAYPQVQEREYCRLSASTIPCGAGILHDAAAAPVVRWGLDLGRVDARGRARGRGRAVAVVPSLGWGLTSLWPLSSAEAFRVRGR